MKRFALLIALHICMTHTMYADMTQHFDFSRRYGTDSPILNSASYFNNNPRKKSSAQKKKRNQAHSITRSISNSSRIKKNQKT